MVHHMIRRLVRRYSAAQLTLAATAFSVAASVILGAGLDILLKGEIVAEDMAMSVIIPSLVAPLVVYGFLRLLRDLERLERELRVLATLDTLTHTYNRRHFLELAERECARAARHNVPLALLMVDVDHFKNINDTWGHLAGDDALRGIADACRSTIRRSDLLARYGGEEFVILSPQAGVRNAAQLAERLRARTQSIRIESLGRTIPVTVSIGVAEFQPQRMDLDALIAEADRALYDAKRKGRDRVEVVAA
jgi:diguanylate cyclase (GGDEF)-like protein